MNWFKTIHTHSKRTVNEYQHITDSEISFIMALLPHGYRWPALVLISRSPAAVHSNIEQIHRLSNYILIHTNNEGFFRILKACISPTGISNNSNPLDSIPCSHEHGCPSLTGLHKSLALFSSTKLISIHSGRMSHRLILSIVGID